MGIDITQWRIEIERCWKFAGRKRSRQKSKGVKTVTATTLLCKPLLALLLSFCLITAPSLLLQAGDVERNPGPEGTRVKEGALPKLLNLLSPVVHSWELFALQIGVPSVQISQIEVANSPTTPTSLYTCLTQVLEWWRANHDNPTYEVIISCLDPKPGGTTPVMNRALACKVREFMAKQQGQGIPKNSGAGNDQLESSSSTVTLPRSPELSIFGQCEQTAEDNGEALKPPTPTTHPPSTTAEQTLHSMPSEYAESQAANHDLRQELQQAQAEVEEKQHAPNPSTRQLQELDELQQTTTKVQQPPMKQNTIQDMKWDKEPTAPESMFRGSAASDLNRAYFNGRGSKKIHSYDSDTQKWDELPIPDTPHIKHTLVMVKDLLTIVGGSSENKATNTILSLTWDWKNRKYRWTPELRKMPSERMNAAAICSGHSLIVAGGYDGARILAVVEILNTKSDASTQQWSTASPLPHPYGSATVSICGESLFMLGGYEKVEEPTRLVLTCSVSKLIKSCQPQSPGVGTIWHRVVDSPFYFSSCATLRNELVLVGGFDDIANAETADFRTYNETTDSWQTIGLGKMPTAQYRALVVVLRDKLMVVGGLLSPRSHFNRFWGTHKDAVNIFH